MSVRYSSDEGWLVTQLIDVFRVEAPGHIPAPRRPAAAHELAGAQVEPIDFPDIYRELRQLNG